MQPEELLQEIKDLAERSKDYGYNTSAIVLYALAASLQGGEDINLSTHVQDYVKSTLLPNVMIKKAMESN